MNTIAADTPASRRAYRRARQIARERARVRSEQCRVVPQSRRLSEQWLALCVPPLALVLAALAFSSCRLPSPAPLLAALDTPAMHHLGVLFALLAPAISLILQRSWPMLVLFGVLTLAALTHTDAATACGGGLNQCIEALAWQPQTG
ncbi:MAG TPA: hypothetical protein VHE37_01860 [Nevskiaceae bacterium]|nr:hypothetical protein [Nevskiaceae bacterium]